MTSAEWIDFDLRASSIKDALDCAMRFEARVIKRISMPSSGVAQTGTALHAGTGAYDQAVIDGKPISVDDAAGVFVDTLRLERNPEEPTDDGVRWESQEERQQAEAVGIKGIANYIAKIGSQRRYYAVESKLERFPIEFPDVKVKINLTGKTDRIRVIPVHAEGGAGHGITDIKSGKSRCTKEGKVQSNAEKAQLAVYELIAERSTGIAITAPAEVAGISTSHGTAGTVLIEGTRPALVGVGDTPGVLDFIAKMLRSGVFAPNPSSYLCSEKFCPLHPKCPYRD